ARAEPQPESKEVAQQRMQYQTAMGLIAVKVQRHTEEQQLHHREREYDIAPQRQSHRAVKQMSDHPGGSRDRQSAASCSTVGAGLPGTPRPSASTAAAHEYETRFRSVCDGIERAICRTPRLFRTLSHTQY